MHNIAPLEQSYDKLYLLEFYYFWTSLYWRHYCKTKLAWQLIELQSHNVYTVTKKDTIG